MNDPIDVSVVIVSYNTRDLLEQCLCSVSESAGNLSVETFVVDNASSDGSCDMVESTYPHVRVVRNAKNAGFAAASNQAIRESSGRYVLLLNPDTIVLGGAIAATMNFMDNNKAVGIATCRILNSDHSFQTCYGDDFPNIRSIITGGSGLRAALASVFMSRKYLATSGVTDRDIVHAHPVAWVMGAYMMIRRRVIEQIGVLDENLFMFGEEPDYCYRARQAGWQMWYTPEGDVIHLGGQSTRLVGQARIVDWLMTTYFCFYRKHKGKAYTFVCYWIVLCASIGKLIMYRLFYVLPAGELKKLRRRDKFAQMQCTLRWCLTHNPFRLTRGVAGR